MPPLWIVHREPRQRAALVRLAAADDAVVGAPGDPRFDAAAAPRVVLLGLAGDFEGELEFARRSLRRLREAAWILLPEPRRVEEARRLFDSISACFVGYPPDAAALRAMIRDAAERPAAPALPLSQRVGREALVSRFSRWFADLDIPELLRALDPRLAEVPVLVRGERGTGRGTLARYLHAFGGTSEGAFVHVPCSPEATAEDLLAAIAAEARTARARRACCIWLEGVDRLAPELQRRLEGWIDYGPPAGSLRTARLRWIGTADDREDEARRIEPGLLRALAGISIRIPPLRERPDLLPNLANNTATTWCTARGEPVRRFGEDALAVLEEYPWPGNLRELESVVAQSLAGGTSNPVGPEDLRLDGLLLAPLEVEAFRERREPEPAARERRLPVVERAEEPAEEPIAEAVEEPISEAVEEPIAELVEEPIAEAVEEPIAEAVEEPVELEATLVEEPEPAAAPAAPRPPAPPPAEPPPAAPVSDATLRRLADAVSHEVRNPLTAIRTFAELLPERYGDSDFRTRFARHVTQGVERVDHVVDALARLAALGPPDRKPVDVSALLESVLDARRQLIRDRNLLVLKELDPTRPIALCDPEQLRFAFEVMLDRALEMLPDRGDLYLASRRHPTGLRGGPAVRVLLRLQMPGRAASPGEGLSPAENSLGFAIAEAVARAQGGSVAIGAGDPAETVVLMDLPAPP
jgi:DNA-binding NtrC family response regulator